MKLLIIKFSPISYHLILLLEWPLLLQAVIHNYSNWVRVQLSDQVTIDFRGIGD
jgi:hypothetical protein